jgi:GNAT superfamily N-acetyltransferase
MSLTVEYDVLDAYATDDVVAALQSLYGTYEWWADREDEAVRAALAGTDEVVFVRDESASARDVGGEGRVVAAARVLTDYVYYAQVYDVIVHEAYRGEGAGRALVEGVGSHPALADVSPSLLAREGLVEFYERCGFEDPGAIEHPDGDPEPLRWLVNREES